MTETQIFYNFSLFNGVTPNLKPDCWLKVIDGHISKIGFGPHPHSHKEIDLGRRIVIPGLIDAHVHLMTFFAPKINPAVLFSLKRQIKLNLANCIRCGVTTVRDAAAAPGFIRRIKRWIDEGKAVGPRIVCTNSFIIPSRAMPEFVPIFPLPMKLFWGGQIAERVNSPEKVRDAVRRMVAAGADWIKTTHSDKSLLLNQPDPPVFSDACFEALLDEARKHDRPVAMHQTQVSGFRKAIELGVDSMEHAPLDVLTDEDIGQMVDSGIPIVPTIKVWRDELLQDRVAELISSEGDAYLCPESIRQTQAVLKMFKIGITQEMSKKKYFPDLVLLERQLPVMMENVKRLYKKGATIGCGTDSGGSLFSVFGRYYEEIENLMEVGLSAFEALKSATIGNARILRLEDKLGTIESGKLADFVVLDKDPLRDILALQQVRMVVKEGSIVFQEGM